MLTPDGRAGVKVWVCRKMFCSFLLLERTVIIATQRFCFYMFWFYEGLQLKICVFLLTLKLPKSSPVNNGYRHDTQSVCLQTTPWPFQVLPPSHSFWKLFTRPPRRSPGRLSDRSVGYSADPCFRRQIVSVWYLFMCRVQTVQNVSKIKMTQTVGCRVCGFIRGARLWQPWWCCRRLKTPDSLPFQDVVRFWFCLETCVSGQVFSEGDWVICRGDRTSDWSGCGRGSRDVAHPGESSGMGTGEGKHEPPLTHCFNHFPEKKHPELSLGGWGVTFAVGIWTAIEGVGISPEAEGWIEGGGIGLKAPWKGRTMTVASFHLGFPKLSTSVPYCISEAWLLVGMFQLLLEGDSCSRNESYMQMRKRTTEWYAKTMGATKVRWTYPAGMWSDCGQGSLAADGGGTAWSEMQMHLEDNNIQLGFLCPKNRPTECKRPFKPILSGVTLVLSTLIS